MDVLSSLWFNRQIYDENGLGQIERERAKIVDNSVFSSAKKFESEIGALAFLTLSVIGFFIVRYVFQTHILRPYAKSIGMRRQFIPRFLENGWYSLYYVTFFLFGSYIYSLESWSLYPTTNLWAGWPLQPFDKLFRFYYLLELSFYIHCTIALFYETKRKDFYQMLTHHLATFLLVSMSYWVRYHRIGLAVLWIHNISDIFLYSAKALNYVQKETKSTWVYNVAESLFTGFAVSFFISRLIFFPLTLVRSTFIVPDDFPLRLHAQISLLVLLGLHTFWFYLILRIIYIKFAKKQDIDDIRSDSEDEDGNPTKNVVKRGADKNKKDK